MPMIPSTSDATANPLLLPAASSVVPSMVNGIPHALQLLAVIALIPGAPRAADRLLAVLLADDARGPVAGGRVGVDRVRVLLDDLAGLRVDQPAVPVEDRDRDRVAAGRALALLGGHRLGGFEPGRAEPAVEPVPAAGRAVLGVEPPATTAEGGGAAPGGGWVV
jgi:hypothetical protein